MDNLIKLHIGCGNKKIKRFINIDSRDLPWVDIVADATNLLMFEKGTVDLIYCSHILEHFGRHKYQDVLKHWISLLKKGGALRISVPNFEAIVEHYLKHKDLSKLVGLLYGGQTYPENYHYYAWDFQSLKEDLEKLGMSEVRCYDWRKTEHSSMDDFSQSYLPHMDKGNGMLMSLNVEAIK
tara:strand:- start:632 stop:1174 length:543 start_codon:yes stop_codon:yes gene_type:complete